MGKTWDEIATEMFHRRNNRGQMLDQMRQIRERYNGDWVLPELGGDTSPLSPTIIADAIDKNGMRAASVMPDIVAPALSAAFDTSKRRASQRRKAWLYTWEKSELNLHLRRAYRHFFGYATAVFDVVPDFDYECPKIRVLDPLHAFPEPKASEDLTPPADCGFLYGHSSTWLRRRYGDRVPNWVQPRTGLSAGEDLWDVVEWTDADHIVIGVLGPRMEGKYSGWNEVGNMRPFELARWPNRAGRCTVVTANRLTLDAIHSQVAKIIGHADLQARLIYLDILATQKSIVPDRFIMGTSAMIPRLVGGTWKGGETGEVNIVLDATAPPGDLRGTPDPNNKITQDRLERYARESTGQAAPQQGFVSGGSRTGRGIDALLSAAIDPLIQEAQEVMQARLTDVNRIVADSFTGYWPERRYTVFSGWTSDPALVEFVPSEVFGETTENKAVYAIPGTDITTITVAVGQLLGTDLIGRRSARTMHPLIKDADAQEVEVLIDKLKDAQLMQLLTQAQDPNSNLTLVDMSRIIELVERGESIAKAVTQAQKEAQERQAAAAPAEPPPGMAAPPELMPGMSNPGTGAEALPSSIPGAPQGLQALDGLLGALTAPAGIGG